MVSARFSKEAMAVYKQYVSKHGSYTRIQQSLLFRHPKFSNTAISSYKTALIQITQYRPMFARIPGQHGMSTHEHLVLEIRAFAMKGSFGTNQWGRPRDVQTVEDISLWVKGLRDSNGGGYVGPY
jgi:hypothetical protein